MPFYFGPKLRVRACACPSCGGNLSGASAISEDEPNLRERPRPGTGSICGYCGALLVFTREMTLRLANARERDEIAEASGTKRFLMAQAAVAGKKPS